MRPLYVSATVCLVLSASSSALAESPESGPPPVAEPATPPSVAPTSSAPVTKPAPSASSPAAGRAPVPPTPNNPSTIDEARSVPKSGHDAPRGRSLDAETETFEGSSYRPPVVVDYEGGRVPKDSQLERRPRTGLIATGIALTGSAYAAALTYAISTCGAQMECRHGSAWLYAPVIGPFVTATRAPTSGGMALAAFDGAVQSIGVALFAAGFLAPKTMVVTYRDTAIRLAPVTVGSSMGVGVVVQSL